MSPEARKAVMPDLCAPTRGTWHSVDSALPTLTRLGVHADQIVVETRGGGWKEGQILSQEPAMGTALTSRTRIRLRVAGFGGVESLPFPMRDEHHAEFRADRLFALFDSPLQKLRHLLRRAGGYLDLRPDDPIGPQRWMEEVFQLDASPWSPERRYALMRLLPVLHQLAGLPDAIPTALELVFGLPAGDVSVEREIVPFAEARRTRLGTRNSRLGVDTVSGPGVEAVARLRITLGPVQLDQYLAHDTPELNAERAAMYRLLVPAHLSDAVEERWIVRPPEGGAHLGDGNRLGINSYLPTHTPAQALPLG